MKIAITGAQSYTGRYVTQLMLAKGASVVNLTNHSRDWNIKSSNIVDRPLKFDRAHLVETLRGCESLVQTYWVRFDNTLGLTRDQVTQNSRMLIDCAREAGVKKIVYTSHTQTSANSPFDYIREKAKVEQYLKESGLKWGIVKPCAIFGRTANESIMLNNTAYLIRRFPVFPLPGDGNYIFHFVHVEDMADLIVKCLESEENLDLDAVGPERLSFKEIVQHTAKILNTTCVPVTGINKSLVLGLTYPMNWMFNDILVDKNDLDIMMSGLTCSLKPHTGKRSFLEWIK
jgi:nucleoside-diphosphate-sugar epimerase